MKGRQGNDEVSGRILALSKIQETEVAELKMLRFTVGMMRVDRTGNKQIRARTQVRRLREVIEARLRWLGHKQRRDSGNIGRRMLKMKLEDQSGDSWMW